MGKVDTENSFRFSALPEGAGVTAGWPTGAGDLEGAVCFILIEIFFLPHLQRCMYMSSQQFPC